jgi:hypothetical protein
MGVETIREAVDHGGYYTNWDKKLPLGSLSFGWGDLKPITNPKRGRQDFHPDDALFIVSTYTSGSDYSHSSLVEKSNYEVFKEEFEDVQGQAWWDVYGGHGTFGIAVRADLDVEHTDLRGDEIIEFFAALEDYPIADEDHHSNLEMETTNEEWENWAAGDFARELEKLFPNVDLEDVDKDEFRSFFEDVREAANEYWESEGMGMYISVERVANKATFEDLMELPGARLIWDEDSDAWDEALDYVEHYVSMREHRLRETLPAGWDARIVAEVGPAFVLEDPMSVDTRIDMAMRREGWF